MKKNDIKELVKKGYAKIAKTGTCCNPLKTSYCCGSNTETVAKNISINIGYSEKEINSVPDGANLGLGCGNPSALAYIKKGDTVLDLGSGAGFDCFLVSKKVGDTGKVIGVDMTHEMIKKARQNAKKGNYKNVEFRYGEIENLPVDDGSVDLIISNCVINLSPEKQKVFKEAYRVLKSGGKVMISDIVLLEKLPKEIRTSIEAYVGCLAGAVMKKEYLNFVRQAGFKNIKIIDETTFPVELMTDQEVIKNFNISPKKLVELSKSLVSITLSAEKK